MVLELIRHRLQSNIPPSVPIQVIYLTGQRHGMTLNGTPFNGTLARKFRMALIGGGGGFIGGVHATAATLDNRAELIAGALSSDPVKARNVAADFGIADDRA